MQFIQQKTLYFQAGSSDKVYEVDLCQTEVDGYVVNFRYGRRGASLREGTKTVFPVSLEKAQDIFNKLVQTKLQKGYYEQGNAPSIPQELTAEKTILQYLEAAIAGTYKAKHWKLSRVVWRTGVLGLEKAIPLLKTLALQAQEEYAKLKPKTKEQEECAMIVYAAVWSLGRMEEKSAVEALNAIDYHSIPRIKNIQRAALVKAKDWAALAYEEGQLDDQLLPLYQLKKYQELSQIVMERLPHLQPDNSHFIYALYLLSMHEAALQPYVQDWLASFPLKPNYWKILRAIFKAAEMLNDMPTVALIARKIESGKAYFSVPDWYDKVWIDRKPIVYKEELPKKDSRLAFSDKTQAYFIRRVLRQLTELGRSNSSLYCPLATHLLLNYNDNSYKQGSDMVRWFYDHQTRRYHEIRVTPHALNHCRFLMLMLFANSDRVDQNGYWTGEKDVDTSKREEAFPALWDKQPQYLIQLLKEAKCKEVLQFALKAFKAQHNVADLMNLDLAVALLKRPYDWAVHFALDWLKTTYRGITATSELLITLLSSNQVDAQELALQWILLQKEQHFQSSLLLKTLFLQENETVIAWCQAHIQDSDFSTSFAVDLLEQIVEKWMTKNVVNEPMAVMITTCFKNTWQHVSFVRVRQLLQHSDVHLQALGIRILQQLPLETLEQERQELAAFYDVEDASIRALVQPLLIQVLAANKDYRSTILLQWTKDLLEVSGTDEIRENKATLILTHLAIELKALVPEVVHFVASKSAAAQRVGAYILEHYVDLKTWSFEQVVTLANKESLQFRKLCWQYFEENEAQVRYERVAALTVLDADWEDTRQFAFTYFDRVYTTNDWTPELLISICDNVRSDVQAFGRQLLTKHFQSQDGVHYLLKLSQHPSTDLQLYTTNYLERYAAGNLEHLKTLRHYFKTILMQINKGKTAKARLYKFLEQQAMEGEAYGAYVASILDEVVLTIAILDKAKCIQILHKIQSTYPAIKTSIKPLQYT